MSQENVEIVRGAYAFMGDLSPVRRGDFDDVYLDYFAHDGELVLPPIYPDAEPAYVGAEGFLRFLNLIDDVFDDWHFETERFLDAGQQVLVLVRTSGTAKQSGAVVTIPAAHVCTLLNRRIVRIEVLLDRAEALEAAGLSE